MQIPVQVTFRNMDHSPLLEGRVREEAAKLERYFDRIMGCRVVVEAHHHHHHKGNLYHLRIDLTVPGAELVVSREPAQHHAHEDVYVAIRDAFDDITRQLEDHARKRRDDVKYHETPSHGRIREIMPAANYGIIETSDGREIHFTRNSVVDSDFDKLDVGDEVRFAEIEGEDGPAASTVHLMGKHHIVG